MYFVVCRGLFENNYLKNFMRNYYLLETLQWNTNKESRMIAISAFLCGRASIRKRQAGDTNLKMDFKRFVEVWQLYIMYYFEIAMYLLHEGHEGFLHSTWLMREGKDYPKQAWSYTALKPWTRLYTVRLSVGKHMVVFSNNMQFRVKKRSS